MIIGDGSGLQISHTGFTSLPSNSRDIALNKVLCVPNIHKNLISVYRLCNNNHVSVEFFPASFQMKDLSTGELLLQDKTKDDLYEWPVTAAAAVACYASPSPNTILSSWHSRLGHPSPPILNIIVSNFSLPLSSSYSKHISCSDCLLNKSHKLPFTESSIASTRPFQFLFSDVWTLQSCQLIASNTIL